MYRISILTVLIVIGLALSSSIGSRQCSQSTGNLPHRMDSKCALVKELFDKFNSSRPLNIDKERRVLIELSSKSAECRKLLINELVEIIKTQDSPFITDENGEYDSWKLAVEILGTIKASEAVGVLTERIHYNNGFTGLNYGHYYPATRALVQLGDSAVPELQKMALRSKLPFQRFLCVRTLADIRTEESRKALENLKTQSNDVDVRNEATKILTS